MDDQPKKKREAMTGWKLVGTILGVCTGLTIGVLSSPYTGIFRVPSTSAPADSLDLAVVIVLLGVANLAKGISIQRRRSQSVVNRSNSRFPLRRANFAIGSLFLRYQLILVCALFFYFDERSWTAESVGLRWDSLEIAFMYGTWSYVLLGVALVVIFKLRGNLSMQADNSMATMAYLWPRARRQKIAMVIAVCFFNPITEEIVYRGILVHQLGRALGGYELPLVLGLFVSLGNHAYQGWRAIFAHTLFYIVAVTLLFSEAGLLGAIVMHFMGDFAPVFGMRRSLRRYRERHRRQAISDNPQPIVVEIEPLETRENYMS